MEIERKQSPDAEASLSASVMDRRGFAKSVVGTLAGVSAASALTPGCAHHDEVLKRTLPKTHGSFKGYQGIADLPYFDLDANGDVVLTPQMREELPWGIDFHAHLGLSLLFAPPLDYSLKTEKTQYLVDCDKHIDRCAYHLDDYLNKIADADMLHEMERALTSSGLGGSEIVKTHTIPNLLRDMDNMKIEQAILLAVVPRLPVRNNVTMAWHEAVEQTGTQSRMNIFGGLNVKDSGAIGRLQKFHAMGMKGVKLHPTMQHLAPDDPKAMEFYEHCDRLNMSVFFHAGRAGIEPRYSRSFARMKNYIAPAREFPNVKFVFGHAGARDFEEATRIAARYPNVWLEIEGQGVTELKHILKHVSDDQIVFGSDFPFFPLAATMARVLVATEHQKASRAKILSANARHILGIA